MSDYGDTNPHVALGLAESAACEPSKWERWIDRVEALLTTAGIAPAHGCQGNMRADGDGRIDGWSLDQLYDWWETGASEHDAVQRMRRAMSERAAYGAEVGR